MTAVQEPQQQRQLFFLLFFLHEDAPPDFIFIVLIDIRLQEEMRVRLWTTSLKSTLGLYSPDG